MPTQRRVAAVLLLSSLLVSAGASADPDSGGFILLCIKQGSDNKQCTKANADIPAIVKCINAEKGKENVKLSFIKLPQMECILKAKAWYRIPANKALIPDIGKTDNGGKCDQLVSKFSNDCAMAIVNISGS
jgi:hypothetical protein